MRHVDVPLLLLVVVAALSAVARRLHLPAPVVLAVGGVALGLVPGFPTVSPDPDVIQSVVLPPLLYAAALEQPTRQVRADWRVLGGLAVGLVLASTIAVAVVASTVVAGLPATAALTLGAILASTDAVAVTALARRLALPRRLLTIVQAESLLNDATSLAVYRVAVGAAASGVALHLGRAGLQLVAVAAGGAVIGLAVARVELLLRRTLDDPLVANALSLLTPFAAYLPAEAAGRSGITAVVVCGLYLSPRTSYALSGATRLQTAAVWRLVVFLLEGVVFVLIGLEVPTLVDSLPSGSGTIVGAQVLAITVTLVVTRVAWVYPMTYLPQLVRRRRRAGPPVPWQLPAVVAWTGTRGVVALAAALSLPLTTSGGAPFPQRTLILTLTCSCILVTLVVQGLTLDPLARRLGVRADPEEERREESLARHAVARVASLRLEELVDLEAASAPVVERLRRTFADELDRTGWHPDGPADLARAGSPPDGTDDVHGAGRVIGPGAAVPLADGVARPAEADRQAYRTLYRYLLEAQREELVRLRDSGAIGDGVLRKLQHGFDLQESAVRSRVD